MTVKLKVLIAEDHTILRAGLRAMLASDPELEVVGEADNGRDAIRAVGQLSPHLVLMDLNMPGTNGMTAITEIRKRYPDTRVRIVTIVAPILTFVQLVLAGIGKWVGGLHVLNAVLILGMYGWLTYRLRHEQTTSAEAGPALIPAG